MIKLQNIKKTYCDKVVLDIDDFEFQDSSIYSIMGSNGCGKSSLLKSIIGLIEVDEGSISSCSSDIHYLPQHPYVFKGSLKDNLFDKGVHSSLIEESDISELLHQEASSLSGGEKQKMLLLRALLQDKKVILLDEPTSDMDVEGTINYELLLKNYQRKKGALIIIVTHSLSQAVRLSDYLVFMVDGKIVESGVSESIVMNPTSDELKKFVRFHQIK